MNFAKWYDKAPAGTHTRLRAAGIGCATIHRLAHGGVIDSYELASRVSELTGGEVSIAELCTKAKGKRS